MDFEVEVSRALVQRVLLGLTLIVFMLIGYLNTANTSAEIPRILSPSLAQTSKYIKTAEIWLRDLGYVDQEFVQIMSRPEVDILRISTQISRLAGLLNEIQAEVDRTRVPVGLEQIHSQLVKAVTDYQIGISYISAWLSSPTADNYNAVVSHLKQLSNALDLVREGRWLSPEFPFNDPPTIPPSIPTPTSYVPSDFRDLLLPTPSNIYVPSSVFQDRSQFGKVLPSWE